MKYAWRSFVGASKTDPARGRAGGQDRVDDVLARRPVGRAEAAAAALAGLGEHQAGARRPGPAGRRPPSQPGSGPRDRAASLKPDLADDPRTPAAARRRTRPSPGGRARSSRSTPPRTGTGGGGRATGNRSNLPSSTKRSKQGAAEEVPDLVPAQGRRACDRGRGVTRAVPHPSFTKSMWRPPCSSMTSSKPRVGAPVSMTTVRAGATRLGGGAAAGRDRRRRARQVIRLMSPLQEPPRQRLAESPVRKRRESAATVRAAGRWVPTNAQTTGPARRRAGAAGRPVVAAGGIGRQLHLRRGPCSANQRSVSQAPDRPRVGPSRSSRRGRARPPTPRW